MIDKIKQNDDVPNQVIGIYGGGQLGKFLIEAAKKLGFKTYLFTDDKDCPAASVTDDILVSEFDNIDNLKQFFAKCNLVSAEFEHIPSNALLEIFNNNETLKAKFIPNIEAFQITQNRFLEKSFLKENNIPHAEFLNVTDDVIKSKCDDVFNNFPEGFILKTKTHGYDGKGQFLIKNDEYQHFINENFADFLITKNIITKPENAKNFIIEKLINFDFECSIIAVRGNEDKFVAYPLTHNIHEHHILKISQPICNNSINHEYCKNLPNLSLSELENLETKAAQISHEIMQKLNYKGTMGIEFFACKSGNGHYELLVNEMAPRVHNSGHWTMDGAETSQFENHVRAITNLELGSAKLKNHVVMINLIGNDINDITKFQNQNCSIYDYGKKKVVAKRKMGHVNIFVS